MREECESDQGRMLDKIRPRNKNGARCILLGSTRIQGESDPVCTLDSRRFYATSYLAQTR